MKPEEWQIDEALENILRNPENRFIWHISLSEIMRKLALISLSDFVKQLEIEKP